MPPSKNPYSVDNLFTYKLIDMISYQYMEPNVITTINIIPSVLALYYLKINNYLYFYIFLIIRILLDAMDGHVARKYNKVTDFGGLYDNLVDLFFYTFLIFLLTYKKNRIICIVSMLVFILISRRIRVPLIYDLFKIIEDNSIILIPLISTILIYL